MHSFSTGSCYAAEKNTALFWFGRTDGDTSGREAKRTAPVGDPSLAFW
jgi:hypothetical protein